MQSEADQLFLHWRDRGDADALARVFDLAAPTLLRLALHLVGDTSAAEDLVQATFVTAMERAATFDGIRPLDPWLAGILTNHARGLKRDARRIDTSIDASDEIESQLELDEHTPLASALAAEESAALTKAVDALPEPYRAVMLLRLRHGMKDADIAHVLDRSPGAVRVQLHRGREMLRKLLPASLVASALLIESGRGLAAVKAEVLLAAGSRVGVAAGVTGGVLVGKKLAAIVALCVCLVLGLIAWRALSATRTDDTRVVAGSYGLDAPAQDRASTMETAKLVTVEREQAVATVAAADLIELPGRVIDSTTGVGIANAHLDLYPPRRTTLFELQERSDGRARPSFSSFVYGWPWPTMLDDLSAMQLAGHDPIDVYEAPAAGSSHFATAITRADGSFTFHCDKAIGFIVCSADGYATRQLAAKPYMHAFKDGADQKIPLESCEIALTSPRRFFGYLVDEEGNRMARRMKLEVSGNVDGPPGPHVGTVNPLTMEDWIVETKPDGSFDEQVAADLVYVHSSEPGVGIATVGIDPKTRQRTKYDTEFRPGKQTEPARLVVVPSPCLVVREKATGKPIERFCMRSSGPGAAMTFSWAGCFFAKEGRLALLEDQQPVYPAITASLSAPRDFTVWFVGFVPAVVHVEDLSKAGEIPVDLEVGEAPRVQGRVHAGEKPIVGIPVVLIARTATEYSEHDSGVLDAARTDATGAFELSAPRGGYTLRIEHESEVQWLPIDAPVSAPIDVDFGVPTTIRAHVRDGAGRVCAVHTLCIQRRELDRLTKTDENGIVEWTRLPEGDFKIMVPWGDPKRSFHADEVIDVKDLHRGEVRDIDITIPLPDPRFARLVVDDNASTLGWKASGSVYSRITDWVDVAADGRVPVDMQHGVNSLKFLAPDQRTWDVPIKKGAPDGFVVHITTEGPGYEGMLTALGDGHPVSRVRINARVGGNTEDAIRTCTTDSQGRFRLPAIGAGKCKLWFQDLAPHNGPDEAFESIGFTPDAEPSLPLARLEIALPRKSGDKWEGLSTGKLKGHVRCSGTQRAVYLSVTAEWVVQGGKVSCSSGMNTGNDGEFSLSVPLVAHYRASVSDSQSRLASFEWDESAPAAVMQRDFDVK